jgi:hypothetical protein
MPQTHLVQVYFSVVEVILPFEYIHSFLMIIYF